MINKSSLKKFKSYLDRDFEPAYGEIIAIKVEKNRIHIQKLLYVSLLNRFDSTLNDFLMENHHLEELNSIIKSSLSQNISEYDVYEIIKGGKNLIDERIKSIVKNKACSRSHVDKLALVLRGSGLTDKEIKKNRINNNTGSIVDSVSASKTHPLSILGYADWLFARRNILVHSASNSFADQVKKKFLDSYSVHLPNSMRLNASSLKTASKFYKDLLDIIK